MPQKQVEANDAVLHQRRVAEDGQGGNEPEENIQEKFLPQGAALHAEGAEEVVEEAQGKA